MCVCLCVCVYMCLYVDLCDFSTVFVCTCGLKMSFILKKQLIA